MEFTRSKKVQQIHTGGTPHVNLLPLAIVERRAQHALLRDWLIRVVGVVVLVGVVCLGLFGWQIVTMANQVAVTQSGEVLLAQIATKSEIQQILNEDKAVLEYSDEAMSTRLNWVDALGRIKSALPAGAWVCAYELAAGGAPAEDPLTAPGLAGNVQLCGAFASASPFLTAISEVDGVLAARAISAEEDGEAGIFKHTIAVELDQRVYASVQEAEKVAADTATEAVADPEEASS